MPLKCKKAQKAYDKAYREANKEKIAARNKAYREANKERIKVNRAARYQANKEKVSDQSKAYHQANKEKILAQSKAYYQANKEKILARHKAHYEANKERITARHKVYNQANKEKIVALAAKYRALKIKNLPTHLRDCPIEKKRLYQTYKLCALFTKITGVQHHVDHMWPLSDGGPHWSGNLQIITATENLSKNATVDPSIKATIQEMLKDIKDVY